LLIDAIDLVIDNMPLTVLVQKDQVGAALSIAAGRGAKNDIWLFVPDLAGILQHTVQG